MWKIVTSILIKQVLLVLLESLEDNTKTEKAVPELTATYTENGTTTFVKKLAKVFERKKTDGAYLIYSKFINF